MSNDCKASAKLLAWAPIRICILTSCTILEVYSCYRAHVDLSGSGPGRAMTDSLLEGSSDFQRTASACMNNHSNERHGDSTYLSAFSGMATSLLASNPLS